MKEYLIWSIEHNSWWKPRKQGYTTLREEAGIYLEDEACIIVWRANKHNLDMPNEALIPYEKKTIRSKK